MTVKYPLSASKYFSAEYLHCCMPLSHEVRPVFTPKKGNAFWFLLITTYRVWICDAQGKLGLFGNGEIAVRRAPMFSLALFPSFVLVCLFKYFILLLVETTR